MKKAKNVLSKSIQINYSIAANGDFNYNLKAKIDSEMPLGYKFLAIIGFSIGNIYIYPVNIAYRNDEYGFQIGNKSSQAWTEKAIIYYLIVPS